MIEQYLTQTEFSSYDDFCKNLHIRVPARFNFAYDVVDRIASEDPSRPAWWGTAASFFQSLGIGRGDRVMLILKRHWQFWTCMMALHKLGAVAIPATHLLTPKDIIYRCDKAKIKMIVAAGDKEIIRHISEAAPDCPTLRYVAVTGSEIPAGWFDLDKATENATPFRRPEIANDNTDTMLLYFTSGTSGEPKR